MPYMLKEKITIIALLINGLVYSQSTSQAQVGINTTSPNSKAFLHISEGSGTNKIYKGVITSRYTTAERDANINVSTLGATDNGLLIYNTTENCYNYFNYVSNTNKKWIRLCETEIKPTSGIIASHIGLPIMVGPTALSGREMISTDLASNVAPLKLAKDDWIQLDFGNRVALLSTQVTNLHIKNISGASISITGTAYSNNAETSYTTSFTVANNTSSSASFPRGIDPYMGASSSTEAGAFGFSASWSEQVTYTFTVTKGSETRNYYGVWTSFPSTEGASSGNGGIKTELLQYIP